MQHPAMVVQAGNRDGDEGDRTPDLLNAIQALSQLSYVPVLSRIGRAASCRRRLGSSRERKIVVGGREGVKWCA